LRLPTGEALMSAQIPALDLILHGGRFTTLDRSKPTASAVAIGGRELRGCASACSIHGHDHACAWSSELPIADLQSFWGALGCACGAV
jgi:hypothetical protein